MYVFGTVKLKCLENNLIYSTIYSPSCRTDISFAYIMSIYLTGDDVTSCHTGNTYEVAELGLLQTKRVPQNKL